MPKMIPQNIVYDKDGKVVGQNLPDADFLKLIQVLSIITTLATTIASKTIAFFSWLKNKFTKAVSSHAQIYMGLGKNLCASADEAGFMLRKLQRQMKPGIRFRVYSNSKMTVDEMETIRTRVWNAIDEPYAWNHILVKAKVAIIDAWNYVTGKIKLAMSKNTDEPEAVCNEQVELIFQPPDGSAPQYRVIPEGVSVKDSVPTDIDTYMGSQAAKDAGWYCAAEYYWIEGA